MRLGEKNTSNIKRVNSEKGSDRSNSCIRHRKKLAPHVREELNVPAIREKFTRILSVFITEATDYNH